MLSYYPAHIVTCRGTHRLCGGLGICDAQKSSVYTLGLPDMKQTRSCKAQ